MTITFEAAAKIVPPTDVITELKDTETKSNYNHDKLKAAFATILAMPMLDIYPDINDRCRAASKVLIAQLESKLVGSGAKQYPMECKIVDFTAVNDFVKETKTKKLNETTGVYEDVVTTENIPNAVIYCICSSPTEGVEAEQAPFTSIKLGMLRLWGDACRVLSSIEKEKTYLISCGVQPYDEYYKMNKNDENGITPMPDDGASVKDMFVRLYEPFTVAEAEYHIGVYRLLHARIKSCRTSLNKKGKLQGNMTVTDVNAQFGKPAEGAPRKDLNITWWNAPEFCVRYGPGSEVYVMIDLQDKGDQYGLSGTGHFIIPILGLPFKTVFDMADSPVNATPTPTAPTPSWQASTAPTPQPNIPSPAAVGKW